MVMDVAMVGCTWYQGTKHWWNGDTGHGGGRGRGRGGTFHGGTLRGGTLRGGTLHGKTLQQWINVEHGIDAVTTGTDEMQLQVDG